MEEKKDTENHFETAKRELLEELNNYDLIYGKDFILQSLNQNSTPLRKLEISRTYGALTSYEFWLYSVKFNITNFNKSHINRWISLNEMRKGMTYDGIIQEVIKKFRIILHT